MKKFLSAFLLFITVGTLVEARADGFGGSGFIQLKVGSGVVPPPATNPPVNEILPEIVPSATSSAVGIDVVGSTLAVNTQVSDWDNAPTSFTCSWHMIGGSSLGTNCSLFGPLTSAMVTACSGSTDPACGRLEVDVVGHNSAGASVAAISDFVGPVETALPMKPFMIIGTGLATSTVTIGGVAATISSHTATNIQGLIPRTAPDPTTANTVVSAGTISSAGYGAMNLPSTLPVYPANFLQATPVSGVIGVQHAIYPGCAIPPAAPNLASGHVFYIDPINGRTQAAGATGASSPPNAAFNNIQAIFQTGQSGYTGMLWNTVIHAGDTIFIRHGDVTHPLGIFNISNIYSTSSGTTSGTVNFTWIANDPADPTAPVFTQIITSGDAGFLLSGLNVESNALDFGTWANQGFFAFASSGSAANPNHDIVFEKNNVTGWKGHSSDPWNPSTYPTTGGYSDGTIQTASPYMGATENTQQISGTAALHATKIFMNSTMPSNGVGGVFNTYVWSADYYFQNADKFNPLTAPINTGIPNGSKVKDYQGLPNISFKGNVATSASLPGTVTNNDAWFANNTLHLWVGVTGTWTDEGLAFIDISKCDPVADAATGCPSTNTPNGTPFVGCDPLIPGVTGGCAGGGAPGFGAAPVWNGTTRAISGELLVFTPAMVVAPNGWWNHVNWDYTNQSFVLGGQQGVNNLDAVNINDVTGNNCVSLKDNTVRYVYDGTAASQVANVMFYNHRIKYRAQDAFRIFSSHRVVIANSFVGDATFQRGHPDIVQFATSFGTESSVFENNAVVNTEGYSYVDVNDQFPDFTQPIGVTDDIYSGTYLGGNIIFNSDNPVGIAGLFNVAVQNVASSDNSFFSANGLKSNAGNKANTTNPTFSFVGNNLVSAINRQQIFPFLLTGTGFGATQGNGTVVVGGTTIPAPVFITSWSATQISGVTPFGVPAPTTANTVVTANGGGATTLSTAGLVSPYSCTLDQTNSQGNVQIPQINYTTGVPGIGNSTFCGSPTYSPGNIVTGSSTSGVFSDHLSWGAQDYRTEVGGVTSPFMEFHPTVPVGPGILPSASPSQCLQNEFTIGSCPASGTIGTMNLRPNPSFVGTPNVITATVQNVINLPQPGTIGASYVTATATFCSAGVAVCGTTAQFGNQVFPAGVYTRIATGTTMAAFGATPASPGPFASNVTPYTPAIIGAGVDLGIQGTPANHGRQAWGGVWNAGAY